MIRNVSSLVPIIIGASLLAQGPPGESPLEIPDHIIFRFFFLRVQQMDVIADRFKSQGKDDSAPRSEIRRTAGLTEAEASLLKEIARSAADDLAAFDRDVAIPTIRSERAKLEQAEKQPSGVLATSLDDQRARVTMNYVDRLRTAMGPARFQQFYEWVKKTETPNIRWLDPNLKERRDPSSFIQQKQQ